MFTERFLRNRRGVKLTIEERASLEAAIVEVRSIDPRTTIIRQGDELSISTLLVEGFMCRYIDDRKGLRQLVAFHVPGDFVDLHAFPLKVLDHDVSTLTTATVAIVPHAAIEALIEARPQIARKIWFSTLLDAAIHRVWLFRLGRLDAVGKVSHFLCETNARLSAIGLSDGRRFALGLTQPDIAEICGLTSIHVNRVLRQLREQELCVFRSSMVDILDLPGLERRAQFDADYLYLEQEPGMDIGGDAL